VQINHGILKATTYRLSKIRDTGASLTSIRTHDFQHLTTGGNAITFNVPWTVDQHPTRLFLHHYLFVQMRTSLFATIALATLTSALPKHCPPKNTYCSKGKFTSKLGAFYANDDPKKFEEVGLIVYNINQREDPTDSMRHGCIELYDGKTAKAQRASNEVRCVFFRYVSPLQNNSCYLSGRKFKLTGVHSEKGCPKDKFISNKDGLQGLYQPDNSAYDYNPEKFPVQKLDGDALSARCFRSNETYVELPDL
jgi:hypothetical protein